MENIVYVSGSHGSGKSTLIRDLSKGKNIYAYGRAYELDIDGVYNSAIFKLTKYYIERSHHQELSKDLQGVAILADRCSYDNLAYTSAFMKLGMMTKEQKLHHDSVFEAMFPKDIRPKNIIYLAPGVDWIKERIEERWKKTGKGWIEDDNDYLAVVVEEFEKMYGGLEGVNILKMTQTDRNERAIIANEWVKAIIGEA